GRRGAARSPPPRRPVRAPTSGSVPTSLPPPGLTSRRSVGLGRAPRPRGAAGDSGVDLVAQRLASRFPPPLALARIARLRVARLPVRGDAPEPRNARRHRDGLQSAGARRVAHTVTRVRREALESLPARLPAMS